MEGVIVLSLCRGNPIANKEKNFKKDDDLNIKVLQNDMWVSYVKIFDNLYVMAKVPKSTIPF